MVFYGLINYWYALNDWRHDVVPAVQCIRSFCERKLIRSHPNNSRHPFFQPNCRSIMVMPMNVKEFDNFFCDQLAIFRPNFVQNCEFCFLSKMLNFVILFFFCPKRMSCVLVSLVMRWKTETGTNCHWDQHHQQTMHSVAVLSTRCWSLHVSPEIYTLTLWLQHRQQDVVQLATVAWDRFKYQSINQSGFISDKKCPW